MAISGVHGVIHRPMLGRLGEAVSRTALAHNLQDTRHLQLDEPQHSRCHNQSAITLIA